MLANMLEIQPRTQLYQTKILYNLMCDKLVCVITLT